MTKPKRESQPEQERWIECSDCGWNLGVDHMFPNVVPYGADLQPGKECPACGQPLHLVAPVHDESSTPGEGRLREALTRLRDTADDRIKNLDKDDISAHWVRDKARQALASTPEGEGERDG